MQIKTAPRVATQQEIQDNVRRWRIEQGLEARPVPRSNDRHRFNNIGDRMSQKAGPR